MPTVLDQLEELVAGYIRASEERCWKCDGRGYLAAGAGITAREGDEIVVRAPIAACGQCNGEGVTRIPWCDLGPAIASDALHLAVQARDAGDFDMMNAALDEGVAFVRRCLEERLKDEQTRAHLMVQLPKLFGGGDPQPTANDEAPKGALTPEDLAALGIEE